MKPKPEIIIPQLKKIIRADIPSSVQIQFALPVDNPGNKLGVSISKKVLHIEVPINYPDLSVTPTMDLVRKSLTILEEERRLSEESTDLNNKKEKASDENS